MKQLATLKYDELSLEGAQFQNPRVFIDGNLINELADSIARQGVLYPLVVWRTKGEDGKEVNVVVDGGRRLRAIAKLVETKKSKGIEKSVPVRFVDAKNLKEARVKALTGNIQRVNLNSYEVAKEMVALKDEGMNQKAIATQLGKSQAWVSRQLSAFTKSSPAVREEWKKGNLPDDDVQHLVSLKKHEEQDKVLAEVMKQRNGEGGKAGKAAKAAARATVKASTGKAGKGGDRVQRPSPEMLARYIAFAKPTTKQRYVKGFIDGLRLAIGEIFDSELDKEWIEAAAKFYGATDRK